MDGPPPPARLEYIPARPRQSGAVWIDGEWTLRRGRWAWKLGRWLIPPADARFSPWAFVHGTDGTPYFAPGVFRDATGKPIDEPPPLAVGRADAVTVVEADGLIAITGRTLHAVDTVVTPPK